MSDAPLCIRPHLLVTGTSSGIGKATMAAALEAGYHVFAGHRSEGTEAEAVGNGLLTFLQLDVTHADQIDAAVARVDDHVGDRGLDGLANIAGIGVPGPLEIMSMDDFRQSFEVDVFGQLALTQRAIPLIRRIRGRIVFIGSLIDRLTVPFMGALASSKSAVAAISDTLRQELHPWGIKVVLVEPGFISTGADAATKERIDRLISEMTPAQSALYGEMFTEMTERGYKVQTSGSSPDGVAAVIMEAFTHKHPHDHYLTGSKAHVGAWLAKLPQPVQDHIKRAAFGIKDVADS